MVTMDDVSVLVTVVGAKSPAEGRDFSRCPCTTRKRPSTPQAVSPVVSSSVKDVFREGNLTSR